MVIFLKATEIALRFKSQRNTLSKSDHFLGDTLTYIPTNLHQYLISSSRVNTSTHRHVYTRML